MNKTNQKYFVGLSMGLLLTGVLAGCSSTQLPVRVFGGQSELQQLAGEWYGEYTSTTTGRNGTIMFSLKAGTDSAHGSIVMFAATQELQGQPLLNNEAPTITWRPVQTLSISFVVIDGNHVRGTLEPYNDPNCHCTVTTLFEGLLSDDTIAGTYSSTGSSLGLMTTGTWRVVRKNTAPEIAGSTNKHP